MKRELFLRWFNNDFWRAFRQKTFPIDIPATKQERDALLARVFEAVFSARYSPSIPSAEIVINKGLGVARTVPVFCIEDYCVYYFCIKELEDVLCVNRTPNTFGGWSLGGRIRRREHEEIESEATDYGRFSFNPLAWSTAFGEFNALLFAQLAGNKYPYVLQFDLSNFYDSIRLDILERWIREQSDKSKGWIIALLFYFLNHWNRRNTGLHPQAVGLPQDALADCSRILSNFYLQRYDEFAAMICENAKATYFRYADDQMILLHNKGLVEPVMLALTRELDRFGLRVNQKKIDLWRTGDLVRHRCRSIQQIFSEKGSNRDPRLVRDFVNSYLSIPRNELAQTWNSGRPLLNRLLWANLESLPQPLFERVVARVMEDDYLMSADAGKLQRLKILNARRARPDDMNERLRKLGERSCHNSFHYEARAYALATGASDLALALEARLRVLDEQMKSRYFE